MFRLTPYEKNTFDIFDAFDDFDRRLFTAPNPCKTDIREDKEKYVIEAEMPGFKKEDIKLDIDGDYLILSAERNSEKEDKDGKYIRRERSYGSFKRSFDISGVNADSIKAEYTDGILKLDLPKKTPEIRTAKRLEIN